MTANSSAPTPAAAELAVAYAQLTTILSSDDSAVKAIQALAAGLARELEPRLKELDIPPRLAADVLVTAVGVAGQLGLFRADEHARAVLNILGTVAYSLSDATTGSEANDE